MPTTTDTPVADCSTVLVGNPNVGKSLLFRNLTRRYVTVSNYPGTTVELVRARASFNGVEQEVVDTPGLNDLSPRSDEARVTRELLSDNPRATIVQVADAKNLRRALLLTLQLAELDQLFDLEVDPQELTNLAADPAHRLTLNQHRRLIFDWATETDDKFPLVQAG